MAYCVVRLDNMHGTTNPADLVSVRYFNGSTEADVQNGSILKLNGILEGQREVYKGVALDADGTSDTVESGTLVLVASPEWQDDERKKNLDEFYNKAGVEPSRGYVLRRGDVFSVTAEAFAAGSTPTETKNKVFTNDGINFIAAASSGNNKIGDIIATETVGKYTYYVIRVCA